MATGSVFHSLIIKKNTSISVYPKGWKIIEVFPVQRSNYKKISGLREIQASHENVVLY